MHPVAPCTAAVGIQQTCFLDNVSSHLVTPKKEELPEVRKSYQDFLDSMRSNSKSPEEKEQAAMFVKVNVKTEVTKKDEELKVEDISGEEEQ